MTQEELDALMAGDMENAGEVSSQIFDVLEELGRFRRGAEKPER